MSFLRHGESIDPMKVYATGSKHLAHSQCSSASMSSRRLFLGRLLSSRACLRFADRERFSKTKPRRTMIFQRTAATPLTPCLSTRVHSIIELPSSFPTLSGTGWHWEQRQRFWPRTGILRNIPAMHITRFIKRLLTLRSPGWERRWVECGYGVSRAIISTLGKRESWNWKHWSTYS